MGVLRTCWPYYTKIKLHMGATYDALYGRNFPFGFTFRAKGGILYLF